MTVESGPSLSRRLADHVTGLRFEDVPGEVVEHAKDRLVQHLGLAFQAIRTTDGQLGIAVARELSRAGGDTTIIGHGTKTSALDAVFANSLLMGHAGMDDGVMPGGAHPSVIVLPAALAVAQQRQSSGPEFLCAVLAGYDVLCKLARLSFAWHAPSPRRPNMIFAPLGSAAAAARLMRLSEADTGHAIAHAADSSMGLLEASAFPYWAHPRLARNGLLAATMAQAGMRMSPTMLEGPYGLYRSFYGRLPDDVDQILDELGRDFEITKTLIKRWPASGFNVLALQYAHDLVEKHAITPDDIDSVTIVLPVERREREEVWEREFERGTVRQSAVRFLVAAVLTDGYLDDARYESPPAPDVTAVLDKTQVAYEEDRPVLYTRLEIVLRDDRHVSLEGDGWDHRHLVKPRDEWREWLHESARGVLPDHQVSRLVELIGDLEHLDDVTDLIACLAPDAVGSGTSHDSATIRSELAELRDRQQIIELHDRLAAILDAMDFAALASMFTEDAVMEGLRGGQWRGAETIADELGAISTHHLASHRMMTNHRIVLAGDRARAVVSFRSSHEDQSDGADAGGLPYGHSHEGWYLSDLARTSAGWRFAWMKRANLSDFLKPGSEGADASDEVYRAHFDRPWG